MSEAWYRLRDGSADDLSALTGLDSSFSNEWGLHLERHGGAVEQTVKLRWRKTKPEGSQRTDLVDPDGELAELRREWERSDRLVIAVAGGCVAGYVMLGTNWNRTAEIVLIAVDASNRRRGLGERFIREAETYARGRSLRALQWEAQTDNRGAIEFAAAAGFRVAAVNDAWYHNRGEARQEAADFRGLAVFLTKELE